MAEFIKSWLDHDDNIDCRHSRTVQSDLQISKMNGPLFSGMGGPGAGQVTEGADAQTMAAVKNVGATCKCFSCGEEFETEWRMLVVERLGLWLTWIDANDYGVLPREDCFIWNHGFCSRWRVRSLHGICTLIHPLKSRPHHLTSTFTTMTGY